MNEKFCPFISNDGKKRACQKNECILYDTKENTCTINKKEKISINDGCNIAIGFTIWALTSGVILFILMDFLGVNLTK